MPVPISVSPPDVVYDVDYLWPAGSNVAMAVGGALDTTGLLGGATAVALLSAATGAGVNTIGLDARGQLYAHFDSDGAGAVVSRTLGFYRVYAPLFNTGLPSGYRVPSYLRVWRVQFGLRTAAATAAVWSCFGLAPEANASPAVPSGTAPFFGLRGNGAGGWAWVSRNAVGAAVQESVNLGISQTAYTVFDLVVRSATAVSAAVAELWANGALLLARNWGAGTVLPAYSAVANGTHFAVIFGALDAGIACAMQVGPMRCTAGRFGADGAEVL